MCETERRERKRDRKRNSIPGSSLLRKGVPLLDLTPQTLRKWNFHEFFELESFPMSVRAWQETEGMLELG